jgi:DMSO/TMAO reductase YedYZ molybdopterin-dependent catalytic subunit
MERFKGILIVIVIVALLAGAVIFVILRGREPKTDLELPQGGTVEVTPLDEMRVRTAEPDPIIDPAEYRISVSGLVDTPLTLTLDQIMGMEPQERLVDLPCVEGWTETALWKGARLSEVLEVAGVQEGANNVVFYSPGGYSTSLTLEDISETDPLLAYDVNGETLPHDQGFPVRLVVPDRLGYKWIKWVTGIEVISGEYEGYWESRGYSNEADASNR